MYINYNYLQYLQEQLIGCTVVKKNLRIEDMKRVYKIT